MPQLLGRTRKTSCRSSVSSVFFFLNSALLCENFTHVSYRVVVHIFQNILNLPCLWSCISITCTSSETVTIVFVYLGLFYLDVALLQHYGTTLCTSCWILRPKCSSFFLLLTSAYILEVSPLDIALRCYTGVDASRLRFMDSVAGQ